MESEGCGRRRRHVHVGRRAFSCQGGGFVDTVSRWAAETAPVSWRAAGIAAAVVPRLNATAPAQVPFGSKVNLGAQQKKTALVGRSGAAAVFSQLLLKALGGIARGIFDVASRLVHVTFCLIGLAFAFHFLVAGELTSTLFYGALGFVRSSFTCSRSIANLLSLIDLCNALVAPAVPWLLPTAVEVMPIAPSGTPNRTGVRVHRRCRVDRIFLNHHRWRYSDRPANDDGGGRLLDNHRGRRAVLVRMSFPLIGLSLAVGTYRQIGGHCWRGKSECTCRTQNRFTHDVPSLVLVFVAHQRKRGSSLLGS